jgi:hypothetical protein
MKIKQLTFEQPMDQGINQDRNFKKLFKQMRMVTQHTNTYGIQQQQY